MGATKKLLDDINLNSDDSIHQEMYQSEQEWYELKLKVKSEKQIKNEREDF